MFTAMTKQLAPVLLGALVAGAGWMYWSSLQATITDLEGQVKTQTDRAELAAKVAASAVSSQLVVTKTVERVVEVKVKGDTIIKEVPRYVTQKADTQCVVTVGTVSLFNSAAANMLLSADAGSFPDRPSGVALSTLTRTAAEWAGLYWQSAERYVGLRAWAEEQGALCRGGGGAAQK